LNLNQIFQQILFLFTNERARDYHQPSHSPSVVGTYSHSTDDITTLPHSLTIPPFPALASPALYQFYPSPAPLWTTCSCLGALLRESFADILATSGKRDSTTRLMMSARRIGFSSKDGSRHAGSISVSYSGGRSTDFSDHYSLSTALI
jgi:hypothetical protein